MADPHSAIIVGSVAGVISALGYKYLTVGTIVFINVGGIETKRSIANKQLWNMLMPHVLRHAI